MNLSIEALAFIQAVQTLGIFVLSGVVIYVVARLDRALAKGSKRLQAALKNQQDHEAALERCWKRIETVEERHTSLVQRINAIEARMVQRIEALDKKNDEQPS